jgi:hypothetical protein
LIVLSQAFWIISFYIDRVTENPTAAFTQELDVGFYPINPGFGGDIGTAVAVLPRFDDFSIFEQVTFCTDG